MTGSDDVFVASTQSALTIAESRSKISRLRASDSGAASITRSHGASSSSVAAVSRRPSAASASSAEIRSRSTILRGDAAIVRGARASASATGS